MNAIPCTSSVFAVAVLSGLIFEDKDGDGRYDSTIDGLVQNAIVTLYNATDNTAIPNRVATTTANGAPGTSLQRGSR